MRPKIKEDKINKLVQNRKFRRFIFLVIIILAATSLISYLILSNTTPTSETEKSTNDTKNIPLDNSSKTTIEDKDFTQNIQIEELQEKFKQLELKINDLKLGNDLSKIVMSFYELQSLIEAETNYDLKLQEFSTLTVRDQNLGIKIEKLSQILRNKDYAIADIEIGFNNAIDNMIALKSKNDPNNRFIDKVKHSLPQIIVVRRIDGKIINKGDEIDAAIVEINQLIKQRYYKKALDKIETLDQDYQKILTKVIKMLQNQIELEQTSYEIFSYLKKISNV